VYASGAGEYRSRTPWSRGRRGGSSTLIRKAEGLIPRGAAKEEKKRKRPTVRQEKKSRSPGEEVL